MNEIKHLLLPLALFTFILIAVIIALLLLYKYFDKRLKIKAVQDIIKTNQDITPAQIQAIVTAKNSKADVRKGFIGVSLAVAFIFFALIMGSSGYAMVQASLLGMAMFPLMLGLSYLYFHFFESK
jgi:sterol desaturase/sphingolipid hydroxylase (fatty acid hydroxylase superfamily)